MTSERSLSLLLAPKDSPALVPSGYGKAAQYVAPMLMKAGWDVRIHATVGHSYNVMQWAEPWSGVELEIWSGGNGAYGEDFIPIHLQKLAEVSGKPSVYFFCGDAIALNQVPQWAARREIPAVAWTAVDWEYPTPKWALEKLSPYLRLWSMSQHGEKVLRQDGLTNVGPALWFGVNPEIWKPMDRSQLPKVMGSMGYTEDTFNVFSCFANQYLRKGEQEMLRAIGEFHLRHPERKIRFFGLTQARRDWDMPALAQHLGIQDLVRWSDDYTHVMGGYGEQDVAAMMACSDVVLALGYEGFGFQSVEAHSMNKRVIGFNAGATPELVADGTILVGTEKPDFMDATMKSRPLPSTPQVLQALEHAWENRHKAPNTRPWILENLTWEKCGQRLVRELESLEDQLAAEDFWGPPAPGEVALEKSRRLLEVGG